jgi:acyl-CoA synthetase
VIGLDDVTPTAEEDAAAGGYADQHPAHPNDCVTICWTSGTEGAPKAVPRAHGDWIAMAWGNVDGPRLTADDVVLNPFPMVNMAGISGMLLAWLMSGSLLVQHHPFDLDTYLRQIERERVTYTLAPPALLTRMLQQPEILAGADISSLRILGSGSAPLSPSLLTGWRDEHGLEIINCFGSNEGLCLNGDPEIVPDAGERARFFPRFGAGGYTWPIRSTRGFRSRLVDATTGEQIDEPGRPGEIRIKGPNVFAGYWTPTGLDRSGFDEEGYFRTGEIFEIATVDGDPRYYHYVSRAKDLIVRGGMNISPAEIEGLVASHPGVAEAAAVGYPDQELGERTCAFVVTRPGAIVTLADIVEHLRGMGVASYKLPERVEVIGELPRNPLGKVVKTELRERLSSGVPGDLDAVRA